jgi:tetratricopeptide (TPR) repeat protein
VIVSGDTGRRSSNPCCSSEKREVTLRPALARQLSGRSAKPLSVWQTENPDRDPSWLYWMSEGELHGQAGSCFIDLGQYTKTVEHFQQAFDAYDAFCVRDRAMCLTRKATAPVHLGKSDEGYAEALQAVDLAQQIDSARLGDHLRTFDLALAGHGSTQLTSDFRQRAAQLLGSSPPVSRT